MKAIDFQPSRFATLGVEVEVQLLDWRTQDLIPAASRILEEIGSDPRFQPEIFQSMLEVSTGICDSVAEVESDLGASMRRLREAARIHGVEVCGAGTHPFAVPENRLIYPTERYRMLLDRNQWIARRLAIFGMHVHIGARDGDHAIDLINGLSPYLGLFLALSVSSPFMRGQDTGLASVRATIFESQPAAGTAPSFASWAEFADHCRVLQSCGAITALKDLWWDIRPNPGYGTVEVRICDGGARLQDVTALVALIQALAIKVDRGPKTSPPPAWRMRENKWRAARWGTGATLVVNDRGGERSLVDEVDRLLEDMKELGHELGVGRQFERIRELARGGGSAARQRSVYLATNSVRAVTQALAREWEDDRDVWIF